MDLIYDIVFNWYTSLAMVSYPPSPNLVAYETAEAGLQLSLPNNQWQIELQDWHGTVLASLQQYLVDHATGPADPSWYRYIQRPNTTAEKTLCHSQKVRISGEYSSVNVFGLAFIIGIGGVILLMDLICQHVVVELKSRRKSGISAWRQDDLLQLHRAAYQARGLGTWKDLSSHVPVTNPGETFKSHWVTDLEKLASDPTVKHGDIKHN